MKKILKKIIGSKVLGNKRGILSLISEKAGKISFKRVGAIMVISWMVNKVEPQEMTTSHALVIGMSLVAIAIPKITELFIKSKEKK